RWCSISLRRTKLLPAPSAHSRHFDCCTIMRATPNCQDRRIRDLSANSAATALKNATHQRPNAI
ncbi:MAG: hypothetical protein ABJD55_03395, partial [Flavobacteriaceae bacterium]